MFLFQLRNCMMCGGKGAFPFPFSFWIFIFWNFSKNYLMELKVR